ncbi:GDSL-type esterase/lipase family protein [Sandaracinus amylolyticus]|uniref:GDSL-type esterase/lipase family protein n=1 Tax=Sandaracinus amylolyticus TaxID=927083 RepID=UPI001F3408FB|nr:GDSL-type esterase/lipase family protein [Sandaracinus amylolyticus]UJR80766.1 Hypothetical protein I5071_28160 [Sandaracinus amylolyticus]
MPSFLVLVAALLAFRGEIFASAERAPTPAASAPARDRPSLGRAIAIEDPSGRALARFHAALRRAEAHEGQARIVVWGASHTAGDEYAGMLRRSLQERFGDAGPGFVSPVKPFRGWNHRAAHADSGGAWRVLRGDRGPVGERYGLAGYAVESQAGGAWASLDTARAETGPRNVGSYEVFFLKQPGGGRFEVRIDDQPAAVVDTDAAAAHAGYARFRVRDDAHRLTVRAMDDAPVRVFGVAMERDRSGVVLDTLGIPGSRARSQLRWDDTLHREHLRRRRPDLVVLAYGTNESEDVDVPLRRYESDLRRVVRRVRGTAPQASCLLIGPSDRPLAQPDGTWAPRPLTQDVIAVQRRVAAEQGCGFFDLVAFMGGPMSMLEWVASDPPFGREDHVHLTWHAHRRLADVLEAALLEGLEPEN